MTEYKQIIGITAEELNNITINENQKINYVDEAEIKELMNIIEERLAHYKKLILNTLKTDEFNFRVKNELIVAAKRAATDNNKSCLVKVLDIDFYDAAFFLKKEICLCGLYSFKSLYDDKIFEKAIKRLYPILKKEVFNCGFDYILNRYIICYLIQTKEGILKEWKDKENKLICKRNTLKLTDLLCYFHNLLEETRKILKGNGCEIELVEIQEIGAGVYLLFQWQ